MSSVLSAAARELGFRIREERLRFAISQMELADLAALHFTNLGKIERGQANPSLHTLLRIAAALDIDPSVLVDGLGADLLPDRSRRVTVADVVRAQQGRPSGAEAGAGTGAGPAA